MFKKYRILAERELLKDGCKPSRFQKVKLLKNKPYAFIAAISQI